MGAEESSYETARAAGIGHHARRRDGMMSPLGFCTVRTVRNGAIQTVVGPTVDKESSFKVRGSSFFAVSVTM